MPKESSTSVKIYYPKHSLEEVVSLLREAVDRLADRLGLLRVVVFGSYARRRFTVASDVDILIIYDEKRCDADTVYKVFRTNLELPRAELHLLSRQQFEKIKDGRWMKTVEAEGIVVHDLLDGGR